MTQNNELLSADEYMAQQSNEELVLQQLEYTNLIKNKKETIDLIKEELLKRVNKENSNLEAGEYCVVKTVRNGAKTLDRPKIEKFIEEMGASLDLFINTAPNKEGVKIQKKKPIIVNIKNV